MSLRGKRVVVWGLGSFGGGAAAARFLAREGAAVTVLDRKPRDAFGGAVAVLEELGVSFVLGREHEADDFRADLVVKSPAVAPDNPWLELLASEGIPWTTELTLGLERVDVPFALVTGSKGKSTTASLAGAMLAGDGTSVAVAGNNEVPLLDVLFPPDPTAPKPERLVLEISSFMADALDVARRAGARFPAPRAVAFTSLSPEHLNWHGTVEAYYGAKLSLLELGPATVVIPADDPELVARVPGAPHTLVLVGGEAPAPSCVVVDGVAVAREGGHEAPLFAVEALQLLGAHNQQNALTAAAVARALGTKAAAIAAGVASFRPLEHRLETVARAADGTRFVNDSTATTPEAAQAALAAAPGPVVLMVGGSGKGADYGELGRAAAARAHTVVCLGEVGEEIAGAVEAAKAAGAGAAAVIRAVGSFEDAFAAARAACPAGGTVLLSPAAASYDMFRNFKARGERFRELARGAAQAV